MTGIEAKNYFLTDLLKEKHYKIEYYQREYAWEEKEVLELLNDLFSKFKEFYVTGHKGLDAREYKEYFLGSIVINNKKNNEEKDTSINRYIVDGQQRLTTLTLIFSYLYKRLGNAAIKRYITSEEYGIEEYNISVSGRKSIMDYILYGEINDMEEIDFIQNHKMKTNYDIIENYFDNLEIYNEELEVFYYWLENKIMMVTIHVPGDEDAYTIFESMNDRGRSLTNAEMLKGYLLSLIDDKRNEASELWVTLCKKFKNDNEFNNFLVLLFRAKYAETSPKSQLKKDKTNDYSYIEKHYYKFIKNNKKEIIGLEKQDAYIFLKNLNYYADLYLYIIEKTRKMEDGYESIYYISKVLPHDFIMLYLGTIAPNDQQKEDKIKTVSKFLDIRSGLLAWNLKSLSSNINLSSYLIALLREIRKLPDNDVLALVKVFYEEVTRERLQDSGWNKISHNSSPSLSDNHSRRKNIMYILSRVTDFLEVEDGRVSVFCDIYNKGYTIEHILAADHNVNIDEFPTQDDLELYRNKIGALGVLEKSVNSSLGNKPYSYKVKKYETHNRFLGLLSSSLYSEKGNLENHPGINKLIKKYPNLKELINPYNSFGKKQITQRNILIAEICKIIWNSDSFEEYTEGIKIKELEIFSDIKLNVENIPKEVTVDIDQYEIPFGSKMIFTLRDSICEFIYTGKGKLELVKIKNGKIINNPETVFKHPNLSMIKIYNSIIKDAKILDSEHYDWEGSVKDTVMLAPAYLLNGKNYKPNNFVVKNYEIIN